MTDEEHSYEVKLTHGARQAYRDICSNADLGRVNKLLDILDTAPYIGHVYDPIYDAARLPFDLLVVYAGHFGIYYVVEEEAKQVLVFFIEDQRRDPLGRFGLK